ncbi:MAG: hypothetical protein IPO69_15980 [Saprospiraceae bacterium]|nr:hypothetical protein [Saprospiraceae bacterium]
MNYSPKSMIGSHGVISGGLRLLQKSDFLKKKLMCYSHQNHYEQYCNAAAAVGAGCSRKVYPSTQRLRQSYRFLANQKSLELDLPVHDIDATLQKIMVLAKNDPN